MQRGMYEIFTECFTSRNFLRVTRRYLRGAWVRMGRIRAGLERHGTRMQTCSMQHATCSMRHATCDMRHATYDMRHATCDGNIQHATCNIFAGITLSSSGSRSAHPTSSRNRSPASPCSSFGKKSRWNFLSSIFSIEVSTFARESNRYS